MNSTRIELGGDPIHPACALVSNLVAIVDYNRIQSFGLVAEISDLHPQQYVMYSFVVLLFQGWFVVVAARPLLDAIGWHGILWLGAGGVAYTLGIVFFALDRLRYFHAAWHLFVLAGSVAHYFAILFYVVPATH